MHISIFTRSFRYICKPLPQNNNNNNNNNNNKIKVFVHGAITKDGLLFVPSDNLLHRHIWGAKPLGRELDFSTDIDIWFKELDEFKNKSMTDFVARPKWEGEGQVESKLGSRPEPSSSSAAPPPSTSSVVGIGMLSSSPPTSPSDKDSDNNEEAEDMIPKKRPFGFYGHYDWSRRRGGEGLLGYHSGSAISRKNIVVQCYLRLFPVEDPTKLVNQIDEKVLSYLASQGIRRVVCGHRPVGTSPMIIKVNKNGHPGGGGTSAQEGDALEIVIADTSFSDSSCADNRGCAAFNLLFKLNHHANKVEETNNNRRRESHEENDDKGHVPTDASPLLSTNTANGGLEAASISNKSSSCNNLHTRVPTELNIVGRLPDGLALDFNTRHELIGRCTRDGWWVVACAPSSVSSAGNKKNDGLLKFLLSQTSDKDVFNCWKEESDLRAELLP
jgi:hypothetical protein